MRRLLRRSFASARELARKDMWGKVNALRELQCASGDELFSKSRYFS
jgi:hypothetical protein